MMDPTIASERAGALVRKLNETLGKDWHSTLAPGEKRIAVLWGNHVALFCSDGALWLRPSDGELMFCCTRGGRWVTGPWVREGRDIRDCSMGPLGDPTLN
jgi:hypothetical protein